MVCCLYTGTNELLYLCTSNSCIIIFNYSDVGYEHNDNPEVSGLQYPAYRFYSPVILTELVGIGFLIFIFPEGRVIGNVVIFLRYLTYYLNF
jgi:hypothetical protein